jgi:hypothetical protein
MSGELSWDEFKALVETKMLDARTLDVNKAPFGLDETEARAWLGGAGSTLQWVLEQMPAAVEG